MEQEEVIESLLEINGLSHKVMHFEIAPRASGVSRLQALLMVRQMKEHMDKLVTHYLPRLGEER